MAELSAKFLILLCPTALPCRWVWSHGGAQAQTLQSLREPRGSSTFLRCVLLLCSSQPALLNGVCVKGWSWELLPFCPSQFAPSRAGLQAFCWVCKREWGQWGICSLLFRLTCSPSLQKWLTKLLNSWVCSLESSRGVIIRPREKAGNKLEWKCILSAS